MGPHIVAHIQTGMLLFISHSNSLYAKTKLSRNMKRKNVQHDNVILRVKSSI